MKSGKGEQNKMERNNYAAGTAAGIPQTILHGVHIGEHSFETDKILDEIKQRCTEEGMNYVVIRLGGRKILPETLYRWAEYLAQNEIYFAYLYTVWPDENGDIVSCLTAETVAQLQRIAGKYFLGDSLGEPGSSYTFKQERYFIGGNMKYPRQNAENMQEARDHFIEALRPYTKIDEKLGIGDIACVEATAFSQHILKAGVNIPILEVMVGNPEVLISNVRGAAKANACKMWGTYIAHEWYGGKWHDDPLKRKRLKLAYDYAYMAGSQIFCLESGDESLESFGTKYDKDHELCRDYREELRRFNRLIQMDRRPAGGPKVKIAFVYGNLESWGGLPTGSTVWGQFEDEKWGCGDAEHSWRILEELEHGLGWYNIDNFGGADLSGHIPYGMYDIVPADTNPEILANYDYLIFVGWNTMTDEIYDNLTAYAEGGGRIIMTAAHLNTNPERGGETRIVRGGRIENLFGCTLDGEYTSKKGMKFARTSVIPGVAYPGVVDYRKDNCDPYYAAGYARYAKTTLAGGTASAVLDDGFAAAECPETAVVEHRCGKGYTVLLTTLEHPGNHAMYPLYKTVLRVLLNAYHQNCDIKVLGSDKLKFAVYEGDVVYVLNTDYDCDVCAVVKKGDQTVKQLLAPGELKRIDLI